MSSEEGKTTVGVIVYERKSTYQECLKRILVPVEAVAVDFFINFVQQEKLFSAGGHSNASYICITCKTQVV